MSAPRVVDYSGQEVQLGRQLGIGGQGSVYELANDTHRVAKIYHRPADSLLSEKLLFMAANAAPELLKFSAWPSTTLHSHVNGRVQGFIMPRVEGREIHVVYGVSHRRKEFPTADWKFLVYASMNCATAFDAIHRLGYVVADVNQKNVVVSERATVGVLDCDSFQMVVSGRVFKCEVGVLEYTPPELQGRPFKDVTRTQNHDLFGLAVHLFHLLFMGRHPFMGTFRSGEKSLQDSIAECRFVYGRDATRKQMQPPPHSLPLALVPPDIGEMFERAFSEQTIRGGRPTANEWRAAMAGLLPKLKACSADRLHRYSSHLGACPWCAVASSGGPLFFVSVTLGGLFFICGVRELDAVWREVERAPKLALSVPVSRERPVTGRPLPQDVVEGQRRAKRTKMAAVVTGIMLLLALIAASNGIPSTDGADHWRLALVGLAGLGFTSSSVALMVTTLRSPYGVERRRRSNDLKSAGGKARDLRRRWSEFAADYWRKYAEVASRLEGARTAFLALQPAFDAEIKQLESEKERMQLRAFLDNHYIKNAKISKIGDGRKATLRGYGIETALDVLEHRNVHVSGFGPSLRQALLSWVQQVSREFRFDPKKGIPENERRSRVAEYRKRQIQLELQMRKGLGDLRNLNDAAATRARQLAAEISAADAQVAQAKADWTVFGESSVAA